MRYFRPLAVQAAQTTRNWTVAGIAGYRCELLCKKSREKHLFDTRRRVHLVWLFVAGVLLLVSLPRGFEHRFVVEELGCPGELADSDSDLDSDGYGGGSSAALAASEGLPGSSSGSSSASSWEVGSEPLLLTFRVMYAILYRGLLLFLVQSGGPVITVFVCFCFNGLYICSFINLGLSELALGTFTLESGALPACPFPAGILISCRAVYINLSVHCATL